MKIWHAILFSLALWAASVVVYYLTHFQATLLMVPITSLWAAIDASRIQLKRYRSNISSGPVVFIACLAMWIVAFPWYLSMRYKIKHGTAVLRDDGARCVLCEEKIDPGTTLCPKCGYTQPA